MSTNRISQIISSVQPPAVWGSTETKQSMTSKEILEACIERLADVTDPPLITVRRHLTSEHASASVNEDKKEITLSLPAGLSETILRRTRNILSHTVPGYKIVFDLTNKAPLVLVTNEELGAGGKSYNHNNEQVNMADLGVIVVKNPAMLHAYVSLAGRIV